MKSIDKITPDTNAKICVQGIAFDENSSYRLGPAKAPPLIREALICGSTNLWSESGIDLGVTDILVNAGDLTPAPGMDGFDEIQLTATQILDTGMKPLFLGGDHSITYPIIKSLSKYHPKLSILQFDAHPDLYDEYDGNKHSHASPFARIMENGLADRLVQVGIRTLNAHQREQAERFGVEIIEMNDWQSGLELEFSTPLYISFDMDCLDPGFAPGVSHWEPGGLSTRQAIDIIQSLSADIVGADIVEFNPEVETGLTAMVAAKILKEIAGKMIENDIVKAVTLSG